MREWLRKKRLQCKAGKSQGIKVLDTNPITEKFCATIDSDKM